jgi:hypothetical protein
VRIGRRNAVVVAALAVALTGAFASSASAAACDPAVYPTPFLRFYGGIYNANTRFIELQVRPGAKTGVQSWSDPAYPFTVTVAPSNGAPRSFTVTNYARQQFPAKFTSRTQTTHVTATYDEIHTTYPLPGTPVNTTCSRTISATYKAPPKPRPTRRGSSGGGGRNTGGQSEDRDDR